MLSGGTLDRAPPAAIILVIGKSSDAYLNPVVSIVFALRGDFL
jgi:glycerol uptake facilitator-like aquaporin